MLNSITALIEKPVQLKSKIADNFFGHILSKVRYCGFTKLCVVKQFLPKNVKSPLFWISTVVFDKK